MKKLFSVILLLAIMLIFTACNSDEPALNVKFENEVIKLDYFQTYTLTPVVESGNFKIDNATWMSSDAAVATVTGGTVSAKKLPNGEEREAIIYLLYNGKMLASCNVIVSPIQPTSIRLDKSHVDLFIGENASLNAAILPKLSFVKNITWTSSDENIATISNEGVVNAVSIGSATIMVNIDGTELIDKCEITVSPKHVTGISCLTDATILVGESTKISPTVEPLDATNTNVTWASSNTGIATVDNEGNVYGNTPGEAIVMVKTEDGGYEAKCKVKVIDISDIVTADAIEGWTITSGSGNVHLSLFFDTNSDTPVLITKIILADKDGNVKSVEYPNKYYTILHKQYLTYYFNVNGGVTGDFINAEKRKLKGWQFLVQYTWNNREYTITCAN